MECTMLSVPFTLNTVNADPGTGIGRDRKEGSPQGQEKPLQTVFLASQLSKMQRGLEWKTISWVGLTQQSGTAFGEKD